MVPQRPILVTGSHRSGTTWIGRMLAETPSVLYIHEPFSVTDAPSRGICNTAFRYWFTFITRQNEAEVYKALRNMLALRYDILGGLRTYRSLKGMRMLCREYLTFGKHHRKDSRVLIKDPMAFFSADWLAERFDMQVVMVIRHPAAFVSSIKKLNWRHPMSHFLGQPALMSQYLSPFANEIREQASAERDLVDEGILLWKLIHHTMIGYQKAHQDWIFVRHEDVSRDPVEEFRKLYGQLGLEYTEQVQQVIDGYSNSSNPIDTDAPVGSEEIIRRNSASNIWNWKSRLTDKEIERIRCAVEDISNAFYSAEDWQ